MDPYSSINGEIPKLKSFFNDHFDWKSKSSYQQLSQLFSYYVPKYNAFVQELRTILQSKSKLETVPLKDVMPYMLIKNFSINGILLHLLCINAQSSYELIERNLSDLCKKVELFHIKYDSTDEDFIGFTENSYRKLLSQTNRQLSEIKNFCYTNLYKEGEEISRLKFHDMVFCLISSFYKYSDDQMMIFIRDEPVPIDESTKKHYYINEKYPLLNIFNLLSKELSNWLITKFPNNFQ